MASFFDLNCRRRDYK